MRVAEEDNCRAVKFDTAEQDSLSAPTRTHPLWPHLNHYRMGWGKTIGAVVAMSSVTALIILVNLSEQFGTKSPSQWIIHYLQVTIPVLCIAAPLALLYGIVTPRLIRRPLSPRIRVIAHAGIILVSVGIGAEAGSRIVAFTGSHVPLEIIRRYTMINGVLFTSVLALAFTFFDRIQAKKQAAERDSERAMHAAMLSRLESLQLRTNPHFLFNSLNTVACLIDEDPRLAEEMLERLASLYHYVLRNSEKDFVTLFDELESVRAYLSIQSTRFGDQLHYSLSIAPGLETSTIPPLTLQPLVENAVKHGTAQRPAGGEILIRAEASKGNLQLTVEDNGPGPGRSAHRGSQTSMEDLRQRLNLIYGTGQHLEMTPGRLGGCRVSVTIPDVPTELNHAG